MTNSTATTIQNTASAQSTEAQASALQDQSALVQTQPLSSLALTELVLLLSLNLVFHGAIAFLTGQFLSPVVDLILFYFCLQNRTQASVSGRLIVFAAVGFFCLSQNPQQSAWLLASHCALFVQWYLCLTAGRRYFKTMILALNAVHGLALSSLQSESWIALVLGLAFLALSAFFALRRLRKREQQNFERVATKATPLRSLTAYLAFFIVSLSVSVLTFVIIPRHALPSSFGSKNLAEVGYGDSVNLSKSGPIRLSHGIVATVEVSRRFSREQKLRGRVFDRYEARRWHDSFDEWHGSLHKNDQVFVNEMFPKRERAATEIKVTHKQLPTQSLFSIGAVQSVTLLDGKELHVNLGLHGELATDAWPPQPFRYVVNCWPELPQAPIHGPAIRHSFSRGLDLPSNMPAAQLKSFVRQTWQLDRQQFRDEFDFVKAMSQKLSQHCSYSLQLKDSGDSDPVWFFLQSRNGGHCELFASALALLLRAHKIPTRLVTGFRLQEWDAVDRQYIVRQSHAHAWIEAYIRHYGWVVFDPTPAASGIESNSPEALQQFWSRHVLNFSNLDQRKYWYLFRAQLLDWGDSVAQLREEHGLPALLLGVLVLSFLLLLFQVLTSRKGGSAEPQRTMKANHEAESTKAIAQLLDLLADNNMGRKSGETLTELTKRLSSDFAINTEVFDVFDEYLAFRFGPEFQTNSDMDCQLAVRIRAQCQQIQQFVANYKKG